MQTLRISHNQPAYITTYNIIINNGGLHIAFECTANALLYCNMCIDLDKHFHVNIHFFT